MRLSPFISGVPLALPQLTFFSLQSHSNCTTLSAIWPKLSQVCHPWPVKMDTDCPDNLPQSLVDQYVPVIDGILKNADLNTISAKKIRAGLQDRFPEYDVNSNKVRLSTAPRRLTIASPR